MTEGKEKMAIVFADGPDGSKTIEVESESLRVLVLYDSKAHPTIKHAAWLVREAMDGLLLAKDPGVKEEAPIIDPAGIRQRQRAAFGSRKRRGYGRNR